MHAFSRALMWCALASLAGCASSPPPPTAGPAQPPAHPCETYTKQLCEALGDKTEPCRALHSVREWLPDSACIAGISDIDQSLARVAELRKDCEALSQRLCSALGEQSVTCEEVKRDLPEVPPGQCRTLLEHYPELLVQLQERESRSRPLPEDQWKALLEGNPPAFGPENAKVTIVEFSDFQCPYCAQASDTVKRIREKYGDQVRLVFRQFPLSFHPHAHGAAEAALAAHAQGKFWPYHDHLFAHQDALDRKSLESYAQELGLDMAAFKKGLDAGTFDSQIDADVALARDAMVDGTPTMFINQQRAPNPTEFSAVEPLIEAALAQN